MTKTKPTLEEIESYRTPAGGYSYTKELLISWGVEWPLERGWRKRLLKEAAKAASPKPTKRTYKLREV